MKRSCIIFLFTAVFARVFPALAEEGMWRLDQLPTDRIASGPRVQITEADLVRLRHAPVRILAGASGGTGSFASVMRRGLLARISDGLRDGWRREKEGL